MVIETPPMGRKEPHDILKSDVRQLSSADQILGAELTWLHMRPLYDQRSVDKRAESPTLVKGLAETLKNLDINSPESEGKAVTDAVPTTGESASALPSTLKKRGSVNYSSSKPLRVLKMNPSESQTLSEYADHYGAPMEALQIGTIPDVKEEGKGLNMEVDQYKVPGKQNVPAPMQRRGTVGKVGFAQVPNAVRLKSPETYYAGVSPAVAVRGTAGQVAQHGTTMFDSGKGSEEPDYVELDEPTHHPNLMDMYLGEVQRTGPPGKCCSGARGNPVHIADEILCNGLYPQRLGPGYPNGHNALTPATSNSSLRSRNLSRTDSVSSGPYSDNGSLGNLAWNRGPNGSAFGGSNNMLTPANSGHFNNTNMQASPGSYGSYPYGGGYGTPGTPASPGTTGSIGSGDGRSPGLHRASVYLPQQEVPNNGMFGDMNYNGSIPESSLDLTNEDCFLCKEKLKNTPIISTSGSHWHENCFVVTRDEEQRQHLLQVVKEIGKRQADPLDTPNASRASKKVKMTSNCFKFVIRGNYEDTLRYINSVREKERANQDCRFLFNTDQNPVDEGCQTPDFFFNEVLNLNTSTGTLKRKKALISGEQNRYSHDSGYSENSLPRYDTNSSTGFSREAVTYTAPKTDELTFLDENMLELIDLARFQPTATTDPLEQVMISQRRVALETQTTSKSVLFEDEIEFFNENILDIQTVKPSLASVHECKTIKKSHSHEVVRSLHKTRGSIQSNLSDLFEENTSITEISSITETESITSLTTSTTSTTTSTASGPKTTSPATTRKPSLVSQFSNQMKSSFKSSRSHSSAALQIGSPDLSRKNSEKGLKLFRSKSAGDLNKNKILPLKPMLETLESWDPEKSKNIQTPSNNNFMQEKKHRSCMDEIRNAMLHASIDVPSMFIYDVDLKSEVWVSEPGKNTIYQLEEFCQNCKDHFLMSAFIVSTGSLFWHSSCFVCVQCFQPFPESIFYEHEDRPYCHNCYTVNFAPMCYTCGGWVIGRVIEALDVKWHPECFGCYMCGAELCENGFFKHNGRPICIGCHNLLKKKKKHICNKCFTPIEDYVLWYLVEPYHPYHFSCQNCFKPLDNKYRDKDGTFYCQLCWDTKIQDVCAACKHTIEGRAIKAATKAWHPEHFVCSHCERPLSGDKFMLNEGKPYCQFHYMKMFGVRCFYCDNRSSMQVIKVLNKNYCEDHFFCAGCDTLLEEKKSKVIEMDMKPYCRHCYDKFPSDMRRKLLETAATMNRSQKKGSTKKDKKGSMKKKKEKKGTEEPTKNGNIDNAVDTAA